MEHEKLDALRNLAITLNSVSDLDIMMETILTEARRFVGAQAGSIYINEGDRLILTYSQNDFFPKSGGFLPYKYQELAITANSLAGYAARSGRLLNIADAYDIPSDSPYRFHPDFDRRTGYVTKSILTIPLTDIRKSVSGVLQIINRLDDEGKATAFTLEDEELMQLFSSTAAMALERAQLIRQMLLRTVKMAELRDPRETTPHARRVGAMAGELYKIWARRRGLDETTLKRNLDHLRIAAMLHDIGKVGVPDLILTKPGRLTLEERREMEKHVLIGLKLFEPISSELDLVIRQAIMGHHERWDGLGYPGWVDPETGALIPGHPELNGRPPGKKGEENSIFGRVTAVADVFDALSSRRVYKDAFDDALVQQIMEQESGHHFDPELVAILLDNQGKIHGIRNRFPE